MATVLQAPALPLAMTSTVFIGRTLCYFLLTMIPTLASVTLQGPYTVWRHRHCHLMDLLCSMGATPRSPPLRQPTFPHTRRTCCKVRQRHVACKPTLQDGGNTVATSIHLQRHYQAPTSILQDQYHPCKRGTLKRPKCTIHHRHPQHRGSSGCQRQISRIL